MKTNNSGSGVNHKDNVWIFFLFLWILASLLMFIIPTSNAFIPKLYLLLSVASITLLATLPNPVALFPIWSIVFGFLIAQTGFQLQVGTITTSALEVVLIALLVIYLLWQEHAPNGIISIKIPGQKLFNLFIIFSLLIYFISIVKGIDPLNALFQMKGFILYPMMIYIFVIGIQEKKTLIFAIVVPLVLFLLTSGVGILSYLTSIEVGQSTIRMGGFYAPINLFGITLASFSLFALGLSIYFQGIKKFGLLIISAFLLMGALTSVSRVVWIMYTLGLIVLFFLNRKGRPWVLLIAAVLTLVLVNNPGNIVWRILQITDSSTNQRIFYLQSGWEAFRTNWLTGAGWGNGQWYLPNIGLMTSGSIPWYHNDYLNLAVQVGIVGLVLYAGYWISVLHYGIKEIRQRPTSFEMATATGALVGLVSLLVAAGFEHVFWRPDIGGVVGWMSGILLASINLEKKARI